MGEFSIEEAFRTPFLFLFFPIIPTLFSPFFFFFTLYSKMEHPTSLDQNDTSLVEEIAEPVHNIPTAPNSRANSILHLPSESRRGSTDIGYNPGYELHPIQPDDQVNVEALPKNHSIIKDTKTGKFFKKVPAPIKVSFSSLIHLGMNSLSTDTDSPLSHLFPLVLPQNPSCSSGPRTFLIPHHPRSPSSSLLF